MGKKRSTVEVILDEIDKALQENGVHLISERFADLDAEITQLSQDCEDWVDYVDMVSGNRFDSERGRLTVTRNARLIA